MSRMAKEQGVDVGSRSNDPPVLILISLSSGPKHGYGLMRDIEGFAGVRLGPGSLYGAISRLEERGLIRPLASAGRSRPYERTHEGQAMLESVIAEMRVLIDEGMTRLSRPPRLALQAGSM
jgi:DNA-binding PadR family transcriptional regulator